MEVKGRPSGKRSVCLITVFENITSCPVPAPEVETFAVTANKTNKLAMNNLTVPKAFLFSTKQK